MKYPCEEVLSNIQKTLHECRDNEKTLYISNNVNLHKCENIQHWLNDVYLHVGLRMEIKNPIIKDKYKIHYTVKKRLLIIE
jgi:hypothetical protein